VKRALLAGAIVILALGRVDAQSIGVEPEPIPVTTGLSRFGISGMSTLVDARIPDRDTVRAQLRYEHVRDAASADETTDRGAFVAGASAFARVEAGLRWPFIVRDATHGEGVTLGIGDLEVAAKGGGDLGWLTPRATWLGLSPYAVARLASGAERLGSAWSVEAGLATSAAFLDQRLVLHLNTAYDHAEGGVDSFRYRVGASVVPVRVPGFGLRLFSFFDGLEGEGTQGSDVRIVAGFQAVILDHLMIGANADYRVATGLPRFRGVEDRGSWGFVATIGLAFTL
jgi:hypothetical protein